MERPVLLDEDHEQKFSAFLAKATKPLDAIVSAVEATLVKKTKDKTETGLWARLSMGSSKEFDMVIESEPLYIQDPPSVRFINGALDFSSPKI